ncbi:MAG: hypothetical protein R6V05_14385, partial [Candidatus Brocadiia bacterium]
MNVTEQKPPPVRRDIEFVPQYYRGKLCYVAKDPVSTNYFRLREPEYIVLHCFQRGMGVEQIQRELRDKTGQEVSAFEIYKFANQLQGSGLLKSKGMGDVPRLAEQKSKMHRQKLRRVLSNYLFITIPVWDPDRFLDRLLPAFRLVWNRFFFALWLVLAAAGLWIIVGNFSQLAADAFSLLSGWNLLILSGVVYGMKLFHELGHGLACKLYGGEVHAIGPAFLVFQPCMFTDTSDAWLMPDKWDRIKVSSSGIIVEVLMASLAALIWISSEPGMVKHVAYTTMIACSISTVLFNANPLLRFDGYYILSDLLEMPNLRMNAEGYLGRLFDRYLLGLEPEQAESVGDERHIYLLYGSVRIVYKLVLVLSIGFFLYSLFEPLGVFMWATSLYGMVLVPMWRRGKRLAQQYSRGKVRSRYLLVLVVLAAAIAGLCLVPIDYSVEAPCVVVPEQATVVRAAVQGQVEQVLVRPGQQVRGGQPLVRMSNDRLSRKAEQTRHRLAEVEVRLRSALAQDAALYRMLGRQAESLRQELQELQERLGRLTLKAPHDGVAVNLHWLEAEVAAPQHDFVQFPPPDAEWTPAAWEGMYVPAGTGLVGVAGEGGFHFETFVSENDVSYLSTGDSLACMVRSAGLVSFDSQVKLITPVDVRTIENLGITLADVGYIPVKPD